MFNYQDVNNEEGIDKIAQQFYTEGYCKVDQVFGKEDAARYCEEANRILDVQKKELVEGIRQNYADFKMYQYSGDHLYNLPRKTRVFDPLLGHPFAVATLDKMLGAQSIILQTELRRPVKGGILDNKGYEFHRDGRMTAQENLWIIVFYMLEDFTETNGATVVIPRTQFSHEPIEHMDTDNAKKVQILGKSGDICFINANLIHTTSENTDGTSRWVLIATYNPWFLKPAVDHTKIFTRSEFDQLTPQMKQVYGFTSVPPSDERKRVYTCRPWEEIVDEIEFAKESNVGQPA